MALAPLVGDKGAQGCTVESVFYPDWDFLFGHGLDGGGVDNLSAIVAHFLSLGIGHLAYNLGVGVLFRIGSHEAVNVGPNLKA